MYMDTIFCHIKAKVIGCANRDARFDAAAGKPGFEPVFVAAGLLIIFNFGVYFARTGINAYCRLQIVFFAPYQDPGPEIGLDIGLIILRLYQEVFNRNRICLLLATGHAKG